MYCSFNFNSTTVGCHLCLVCCSLCCLLQSVAVCCSLFPLCCSLSQRVVVFGSVMQWWCSVLLCVIVCCSVLQCAAVCCSVWLDWLVCDMIDVYATWLVHMRHDSCTCDMTHSCEWKGAFMCGISHVRNVTYACHICLSHMLVTYACHICLSHMLVTYACHICLSHMLVTYAFTQTGREEVWPSGRNRKNRVGKNEENYTFGFLRGVLDMKDPLRLQASLSHMWLHMNGCCGNCHSCAYCMAHSSMRRDSIICDITRH